MSIPRGNDGLEDSSSSHGLVSVDEESNNGNEGQPLQANSVRKLQCFIAMLIMILLGFVASLNEAKVFYHSLNKDCLNNSKWYMPDTGTDYVCWCYKFVQLSMATAAIVYLQAWVIDWKRVIPLGTFNRKTKPFKKMALKNVHCVLEMPKKFANYPSKLFLSIFVVFAVLGGVCGISELIYGFMDSIKQDIHQNIPYFEVIRRILLIVFVIVQAQFFFKHNRACVQWKLNEVWLCMCIVIATNLTSWVFYVQLEVREIVTHREKIECYNNSDHFNFTRVTMEEISHIFFPFLLEFFLMASIACWSFLSNAGRLAWVLEDNRRSELERVTTDSLKSLLCFEDKCSAGGYWRQHRRSLAFGVSLVLAALTASLVLKFNKKYDQSAMKLVLTFVLAAMYIGGLICCAFLLRAFSSMKEKKSHSSGENHTADRLLLWCGAAAILMNDIERLWTRFSNEGGSWQDGLSTGLVTLSNMAQSVLQVYVLECILVRKMRPTSRVQLDHLRGTTMLTALILLNAAEWLLSAVAFNIFFIDGRHADPVNTVVATFTLPLQVFFRFHSIACIHEFKKHRTEHYESLEDPSESVACVEFPATLTHRGYGTIL